jgi:hypothetical protein
MTCGEVGSGEAGRGLVRCGVGAVRQGKASSGKVRCGMVLRYKFNTF